MNKEVMKKLVALEEELEGLAARRVQVRDQIRELYEMRTEVNQEIGRVSTEIENLKLANQ